MLNKTKEKSFEIIKGIRENSEIIILDFNQITSSLQPYKNIKIFFEENKKKGIDPTSPDMRQKFNNEFIRKSGKEFLIGRYGEDRKEMLKDSHIEKEGRTIHLGVDIFSSELKNVHAPYDGEVIRVEFEPGSHSYGHYAIIKHKINGQVLYTFYGHLSKNLPKLGLINMGERIGTLGDFVNGENGGWSRHLHFQILTELPEKGTPIGYSKKEDFEKNKIKFPDPNTILQLNL